jgi:hypothetical protein
MVSELALFQIASITALVGMSLGWRGVMTKYSGFYDLPTAWSMIFWGILIGGFYGLWTDKLLLGPYLGRGQFSLSNLLICLIMAVVVHMMLKRKKVRSTGSQPTTGWALGLSVGGMVSMYLIYRLFEREELSIILLATVLLVAIISPRAHALIFCLHGFNMLKDMRLRAVIRTFVWLVLLISALYTAVLNPLIWIFIIPVMIFAERAAQDWVWSAIPKPARRRLRRIWADASRTSASEEE